MQVQAQSVPESDAARPHAYSSNGRLFAAAISLARKGRYADASKTLRRALEAGACSEAEALDLQARIYAQRGLYLEAEGCWRQAKSGGAPNQEYQDALARLRRARLATARGLYVLAALFVALLLGLTVWQVFVTTPELMQQIDQQKAAMASIQHSIDNTADAAAVRDAEIATSIDAFDRNGTQHNSQLAAIMGSFQENVDKRGKQLTEAIALLATGEDATSNRETMLERFSQATAALQVANQTSFEGLTLERAKADDAAQKQIAVLNASLATLAESFESTELALTKRIAQSESAASKQLHEAITGVAKRIDGIPISDSLTEVENRIERLNAQLAAIASAIEKLKSQQLSDADTGNKPTTDLKRGQAIEAIQTRDTQP